MKRKMTNKTATELEKYEYTVLAYEDKALSLAVMIARIEREKQRLDVQVEEQKDKIHDLTKEHKLKEESFHFALKAAREKVEDAESRVEELEEELEQAQSPEPVSHKGANKKLNFDVEDFVSDPDYGIKYTSTPKDKPLPNRSLSFNPTNPFLSPGYQQNQSVAANTPHNWDLFLKRKATTETEPVDEQVEEEDEIETVSDQEPSVSSRVATPDVTQPIDPPRRPKRQAARAAVQKLKKLFKRRPSESDSE